MTQSANSFIPGHWSFEFSKLIVSNNFLCYKNNTRAYSSAHCAFLVNILGRTKPTSHAQAIHDPNWQWAMQTESEALQYSDTWSMVHLPIGHKPIDCKWVYKIKIQIRQHHCLLQSPSFCQGLHSRALITINVFRPPPNSAPFGVSSILHLPVIGISTN